VLAFPHHSKDYTRERRGRADTHEPPYLLKHPQKKATHLCGDKATRFAVCSNHKLDLVPDLNVVLVHRQLRVVEEEGALRLE
jgi:hypothetical protein